MNIKVKILRSWHKKEINNIPLVTKTRNKKAIRLYVSPYFFTMCVNQREYAKCIFIHVH